MSTCTVSLSLVWSSRYFFGAFTYVRTVDTRSPSPRLYRLITHKFKVTRGTSLHEAPASPRCILHTTTTQERTCQGLCPTVRILRSIIYRFALPFPITTRNIIRHTRSYLPTRARSCSYEAAKRSSKRHKRKQETLKALKQ